MSLYVIEDTKEKNHDVKRETFPVGFCALYFEIKILHMRNSMGYSSLLIQCETFKFYVLEKINATF